MNMKRNFRNSGDSKLQILKKIYLIKNIDERKVEFPQKGEFANTYN